MRLPVAALLGLLASPFAHAQTCPFTLWTHYPPSQLLRHPGGAYMFSTSKVNIDADGAPNAYHPDDVNLSCTKGTGFRGLDCPANAGYPNSSWWPSVLAPDPKNPSQPYIQPPGSETAGFFVSMTSLRDTTLDPTDIRSHVDSRAIPYIVFPRAFYKMKGTGSLGDVGFALNTLNGRKTPFIVAEIGPLNAELGEVSIAMATALGGENPNPRTGAGAPLGKVLYIVFPNSSATPRWPRALDGIDRAVQALLATVGGEKAILACKEAF